MNLRLVYSSTNHRVLVEGGLDDRLLVHPHGVVGGVDPRLDRLGVVRDQRLPR